jgi:hypothetical protein
MDLPDGEEEGMNLIECLDNARATACRGRPPPPVPLLPAHRHTRRPRPAVLLRRLVDDDVHSSYYYHRQHLRVVDLVQNDVSTEGESD